MVTAIAVVAAFAVATAADKPGVTPAGAAAQAGTGVPPEATRGTAWIQYDDGTSELGGWDVAPTGGNVGNIFVPGGGWGTFYADQLSVFYRAWSGGGFSVSAYSGLNGPATALTGNSYIWFVASPGTGTNAWHLITAAQGWIGNTTYNWNGNAYIGAYNSNNDNVGVDTSGAHGYSCTNYSGTGYAPGAWNAMLRVRFNGPAVPVELTNFVAE